MSPPKTVQGATPASVSPPNTNPATATAPSHGQRSRSAAFLVAHALVLLSGPNAVFDRLIVRVCPVEGCSYAHLHVVPVGAWRQPLVRAPRCRPGLRYRIEVVDVVPAVPVLAGQRRRWTA